METSPRFLLRNEKYIAVCLLVTYVTSIQISCSQCFNVFDNSLIEDYIYVGATHQLDFSMTGFRT